MALAMQPRRGVRRCGLMDNDGIKRYRYCENCGTFHWTKWEENNPDEMCKLAEKWSPEALTYFGALALIVPGDVTPSYYLAYLEALKEAKESRGG